MEETKQSKDKKREIVVVALGRNSFGRTIPEQKEHVHTAAVAVADLVEAGYIPVVTHSNGPQIGMIQTAMTEYSRLEPEFTVAPMSVCGAMSQGYIGYDLQNEIRTELLDRGIYMPVCTIITQVRVDPFDRAFTHPTKVIGRVMNRTEADAEEAKGNFVTEEDGGFRRIIPSPKPVEIYEIDSIRALVNAEQIVIACGGGGIPVMQQGTRLKGASAIIEKDATAARLAGELDADAMLFLTHREFLTEKTGTPEEKKIGEISVAEAEKLIEEQGNFTAGLDKAKMEAAIEFVASARDKARKAVITSTENALAGLKGRTGTVIK